jgi:hypothetical protein
MLRILGSIRDVAAIALALAIVLSVGWMVSRYFALHLLLNDTTRYLYQYREMTHRGGDVSLVPRLFAGGESKQHVKTRLIGAGLEDWSNAYAGVPPGAESAQLFRLGAGGLKFSCSSELFLTIGYDVGGRLVSASIAQGGVCL